VEVGLREGEVVGGGVGEADAPSVTVVEGVLERLGVIDGVGVGVGEAEALALALPLALPVADWGGEGEAVAVRVAGMGESVGTVASSLKEGEALGLELGLELGLTWALEVLLPPPPPPAPPPPPSNGPAEKDARVVVDKVGAGVDRGLPLGVGEGTGGGSEGRGVEVRVAAAGVMVVVVVGVRKAGRGEMLGVGETLGVGVGEGDGARKVMLITADTLIDPAKVMSRYVCARPQVDHRAYPPGRLLQVRVMLCGTGEAGKERRGDCVSWYWAPLLVFKLVTAVKEAGVATGAALVYVTPTSTVPQHSRGPSYTRHTP
jgi:hypothetical protein